jgi:hypothetical protein
LDARLMDVSLPCTGLCKKKGLHPFDTDCGALDVESHSNLVACWCLEHRHHLARALYDLGKMTTYCKVLDNLSESKPEAFWQHMQDSNEVYLKDSQGNVITPLDLPASVKDLRDDPFRSLAGAVRESCGFSKDDKGFPDANYLEFKWADYLRAYWARTGIPADDIDANFDNATQAALQLAIQKEAANLPGFTGQVSCQ